MKIEKSQQLLRKRSKKLTKVIVFSKQVAKKRAREIGGGATARRIKMY